MIRMEMNLKGNVMSTCSVEVRFIAFYVMWFIYMRNFNHYAVKDIPVSSFEWFKSDNIIHFEKLYTLFNLNGYFAVYKMYLMMCVLYLHSVVIEWNSNYSIKVFNFYILWENFISIIKLSFWGIAIFSIQYCNVKSMISSGIPTTFTFRF